mmetsp:Transcript_22666/g.49801  ORF Transcript_22666/g.49801 Transcript_22666/m.49801 type:complete len:528 (+) Transcript_22666:444-2027(+)
MAQGNPSKELERAQAQYQHWCLSQEHLLRQSAENPLPTTVPPPTAGLAGAIGQRLVISFIGLPARGKPFLAERLNHYLSFFHGANCKSFDIAKDEWADDKTLAEALKEFLEEDDPLAAQQLLTALGVESEHGRHLKNVDSGRIAILYSHSEIQTAQRTWSGSSKEHRWSMQKALSQLRVHCNLMFIEVIVSDTELVERFILNRMGARKDCSGRYVINGVVQEDAVIKAKLTETAGQIKDYHRLYVTIQDDGSEDDLCYMKLYNYGQRVVTNQMHGFLCMRIAQYVSHLHPRSHTIYLTRHGQSTYNVMHKIGGNPGLTEAGESYASWLGEWVPENVCKGSEGEKQVCCRLWTSSMRRTIDTARHIPHPVLDLGNGQVWQQMATRVYRNLDEIFAGEYEGMTYKQIEETFGDEAILRKKDKLGYRYPRGESYFDLIARLEVLMHELESYEEPLLIVSHQATLRMLYAYLMGIDRSQAPKLDIPLHAVIKIQYDGFGRHGQTAVEERFFCPTSAQSTQNPTDTDGQKHL